MFNLAVETRRRNDRLEKPVFRVCLRRGAAQRISHLQRLAVDASLDGCLRAIRACQRNNAAIAENRRRFPAAIGGDCRNKTA